MKLNSATAQFTVFWKWLLFFEDILFIYFILEILYIKVFQIFELLTLCNKFNIAIFTELTYNI